MISKKLIVTIIALVISFSLPLSAKRSHEYIHSAMYQVKIVDVGLCTAYATGPHTILIAEHCLGEGASAKSFVFDPGTPDEKTASISEEIFDHEDHVIVRLNGIKFRDWVDVDMRAIPQQNDRVHYWGACASIYCNDCYREGYYSGLAKVPPEQLGGIAKNGDMLLFVIVGIPGDSGSLIFDQNNNIVGMTSIGTNGFVGSFVFQFTEVQWEKAKR